MMLRHSRWVRARARARSGRAKRARPKLILVGALAALVAVAAAITPLATGAPPKFYTLTVDKTAVCSTAERQTFTLTLTNQSRNNSLGSANITAPEYATLVSATVTPSGTATVDTSTNTIQLRNVGLTTTGSAATITAQADVSEGSGQVWESVVKQSNSFADAGPGNLFTLSGASPGLTVSQCKYAFVQGPVDATRNVAQTVKVQLQTSSGAKVTGSGDLTLTAHQDIDSTTTLGSDFFTGLTAGAANGEWSFLVTGKVSGTNYSLRAPDETRSSYFLIADCVPDASGNCTTAAPVLNVNGDTGASINASGINSPIILSFESIPPEGAAGRAMCEQHWAWSPLTFPEQPDGRTNFDGITLSDFTYANTTGFVKLTTFLRNDLYVQTNPSNTNDVQICAGGRHSIPANNTEAVQGGESGAFMGRGGKKAKWDTATGLYWGVLERIPNCNRARDLNNDGILDPALCGWGTVDIGGVLYRSATVLIPYDWDWKGVT
jgi:hypothetical protein